MSQSPERGGLGTVRNAVLLLALLAEGEGFQQLTDLGERSGMSLPTVHRLLRSLTMADLVSQDPRSSRYGLGPELARLSNRYRARLPVLGALAPYLVQLRDTVGTTIEVQILVGESAVTVDQVDGSEGGPYRRTNTVVPALHSAGGCLLAARADPGQWRHILHAVSAPEQDRAEASHDEWADSTWLQRAPARVGEPCEVAASVIPSGGSGAALVALVPEPAAPDRIAAIAGHLVRAAEAALRTVGHA